MVHRELHKIIRPFAPEQSIYFCNQTWLQRVQNLSKIWRKIQFFTIVNRLTANMIGSSYDMWPLLNETLGNYHLTRDKRRDTLCAPTPRWFLQRPLEVIYNWTSLISILFICSHSSANFIHFLLLLIGSTNPESTITLTWWVPEEQQLQSCGEAVCFYQSQFLPSNPVRHFDLISSGKK